VADLSPARVRLALLALALGGFGIGISEFVAMGLLPDIAADLLPTVWARSQEQANAQAGWIISAYALGVVVGAPTIAPFVARFPRKRVLSVCVAVFVVATAAAAIAPTFELVLVARFVAALPHGAYFGIAALVAASLMGPGMRGRGIAFVLGGLSIANVIGVPAITFLGQSTSWRVAYLTVAVVFALTLAAIALVVPHQSGDATATMRRELSALRRGQVWVVLGCGALGFGGLFAVYTFIAPVATEVTGLPASSVPLVLVVLGIGMTIGNAAGGRGSDHHVVGTVFVCFAVFAIALAGFALTASTPVGLFVFAFLVGGAAFALGPAIQSWVIDVSGDSQTMAAALNHSALNLGNSLGAWLGGVTIAAGLGYLSPAWVGLALCVPGVILAVVGAVLSRRARRLEVAGQV